MIDWSKLGPANAPAPSAPNTTAPVAPSAPGSLTVPTIPNFGTGAVNQPYETGKGYHEATQEQVDALDPGERVGRGIDFLGNALFGHDNGSPLGGVPLLGDILGGVGDIGHTIGNVTVVKPVEAVAHVASHVPLGWLPGGADDAFKQFGDWAAKNDPKVYEEWRLVNAASNADVLGGGNMKADWNMEFAKYLDDKSYNSTLGTTPDIAMGRTGVGSLGGAFTHAMVGFLGLGANTSQRLLGSIGAFDPADPIKNGLGGRLNRVEESAKRLDAGEDVSDVEKHAVEAWRSGEWSLDHAQDYIVSHGQGVTRNVVGQLAVSLATDPLIYATVGAGAIAKAGQVGTRLAEAGVDASTTYEKLAATVSSVQQSQMGPAFRIARGFVDPLAVYKPSSVQAAVTDLRNGVALKSFERAYGRNTVEDMRSLGREFGIGSEVDSAMASYSIDQANLMIAIRAQSDALKEGLGEELVHSSVDDVIDPLVRNAGRDAETELTDHMLKVSKNTFTAEEDANFAGRMAATFGGDSAAWTSRMAGMSDDLKSALHAITYKRAETEFEEARAAINTADYKGDLPLRNMVLMSTDTLDNEVAQNVIDNITAVLKDENTPDRIAAATAEWNAQAIRYPKMASIGYATGGKEQVEALVRELNKQLEKGALSRRALPDELKDPALRPVRDMLDRNSLPGDPNAFTPAEGLSPQPLMDEFGWPLAKAQELVDNAEMVPTKMLEPLREIDRRANPELSLHQDLEALQADIAAKGGINSPIIVWYDPATGATVVADGNHRLTVALEQGWEKVPVVIEARPTNEVAQAENIASIARITPKPGAPTTGVIRPSEFLPGSVIKPGRASVGVPEPPQVALPPVPGEAPLAPGMIRAYHYTSPEGLEGIRGSGLDVSKAKGSTYGEPDSIWFSTAKPEADRPFVEVHLRPEELDVGGPMNAKDVWSQARIDEFNARGGNFTVKASNVPADRIVSYNESWMHTYRKLVADAPKDEAGFRESFGHWLNEDPNGPYGNIRRAVETRLKDLEAARDVPEPVVLTPGNYSHLPGTDDAGFVYHVTDDQSLRDIAESGIEPHTPAHRGEQDFWPDGSEAARSYFTKTAKGTEPFQAEGGRPAILRVKSGPGFSAERGTGDIITEGHIPPKDIEYLTADGKWAPVKPVAAAPVVDEAAVKAAREANIQYTRDLADYKLKVEKYESDLDAYAAEGAPTVAPAEAKQYEADLAKYEADKAAYDDAVAVAEESTGAHLDDFATKWNDRGKNHLAMEKDLVKLEGEGYDVHDAMDSLDEYRNVERGDFTDAEEYQQARDDAWQQVIDDVAAMDSQDVTDKALEGLVEPVAPTPPVASEVAPPPVKPVAPVKPAPAPVVEAPLAPAEPDITIPDPTLPRPLWNVGFRPDEEVAWGLKRDVNTGRYIVERDPTISHVVDAVPGRQVFSDTTRNVLGQVIGVSKAERLNRPIESVEAYMNTLRDGITGRRLVMNIERRFEKSTFDAGIPKPLSKEIYAKAREVAGLEFTTVRGIKPDNLWNAIHDIVPRDLVLKDGSTLNVHIVMDHLLAAAEGDLRIMGVTSVLSQRMRNALRATGMDPANWAGQMTVTMYNKLRYSQPMFLIQRITDAPYYSILYGVTPVGKSALRGENAELRAITDNLGRTGLGRDFSMDMPEYATRSNFTEGIKSQMQEMGLLQSKIDRVLRSPDTIIANNMTNMLHARLGDIVKGALDNLAAAAKNADPAMQAEMIAAHDVLGRSFADWRRVYSEAAGRVLDDNEVGLRYIQDQLNAWRRVVVKEDGTLDFSRLIAEGERSMPDDIADIGTIRPDILAQELGYADSAALRRDVMGHVEKINGVFTVVKGEHDVAWLEEKLRHDLGAHPDYTKRTLAYYGETWDDFWTRLSRGVDEGGLDISPHYAKEAKDLIAIWARDRNMDPWEYLSGVMASNIGAKDLETHIGQLMGFLKSGKSKQPIEEWTKMFRSTLDVSAQKELLQEFESAVNVEDVIKVPEPAPFRVEADGSPMLPVTFKQDQGYIYRIETLATARSGWKPGTRMSVVADAKDVRQVAGEGIFRVKADGVISMKPMNANGRLTTAHVPPENIEMLGKDGLWKTLGPDPMDTIMAKDFPDAVRERLISGTPHANPEVEAYIEQFSKWVQSSIKETMSTRTRLDLRRLVAEVPTAHAAPYNRSQALVTSLLKNKIEDSQQDIFRLAEMQTKRTLLERSLNHPLFGLYPASYMWGKVLPETVKFLAKNPYAATYAIANVQRSIAIQREYDRDIEDKVSSVDRSAGAFLLDYLTPGLPWSDHEARMSPMVRDLLGGKGLEAAWSDELATITPDRWVRQVVSSIKELPGAAEDLTAPEQTLGPQGDMLQKLTGAPSAPTSDTSVEITGPTKASALAPILADDLSRLQSILLDGQPAEE